MVTHTVGYNWNAILRLSSVRVWYHPDQAIPLVQKPAWLSYLGIKSKTRGKLHKQH